MLPCGHPHPGAAIGVADQSDERLDAARMVNGGELCRLADIEVVIIEPSRMPKGEIEAGSRRSQMIRHEKSVYSMAHGVTIAVPVGNHHWKPGRHRLKRREAEGLLNIIGQ